MGYSKIKFNKSKENIKFYKTLQKRVRAYFKDNNISKYGNFNMVIKTIFMISLYIVPFILLLTIINSVGISFLMWSLMGIGIAGIGLSIMHDANHGSYSKNKNVNKILGGSIGMAGGSDSMWRIQHNILHHTYTNVTGVDGDIDPGELMRFSPHEKRLNHHRYQHIYGWFLYGLMTLMWITVKDFKQIIQFKSMKLIQTQTKSANKLLFRIILNKIIYYGIVLVLPLIFVPIPWYLTLLGFLSMHYITGFILGCIFQPAHVVPSADYPIPDESGNIKADWAVSQLVNTSNFAPKSTLFSWYVGGLNFQIEHHLFPNVCHVHYKNISKIVKKTTEDFNLPYNSEKTFISALKSHGKMLRKLGSQDKI